MNSMKKYIKQFKKGSGILFILFMSSFALLSLFAWFMSYQLGYATAYNDAMAHMNISRFVVDNMQPGFTQLGGVWLPMTHILPLLLVWNDWAWHSGFAGSLFSMISYGLSIWSIFHIIRLISKNTIMAVIGSAIFALNLNMLYLQTTPLTEPMYIALFLLSSLFFIKYVLQNKVEYLVYLGFFSLLQVLTRYDGWFVAVATIFLLTYHELFVRKTVIKNILGKVLIVAIPITFGISMWLLWNLLIFDNPLYFAVGPNSAHAQQDYIQQNTGLITKYNALNSLKAYWFAFIDNVGFYLTLASFIGMGYFLLGKNIIRSLNKKLVIIAFLSLPIIFNVISLFLGFSILNVPSLGWNPSNDPSGFWFNVRYGIFALPFVAIFAGMLSFRKTVGAFVVMLLVVQTYIISQQGIITLIDGTVGSSSFKNNDIAQELKHRVAPDEKVMMATSYFSPVSFTSEIPLQQIVHEGIHNTWDYAIVYPENYDVTWIVVANGNVGDPIYTSLVENQKNRFLALYTLVYEGEHAHLYKRNEVPATAVSLKK